MRTTLDRMDASEERHGETMNNRVSYLMLVVAVLALTLGGAPRAFAVDRYWSGGTATYNTPAAWTGGSVPVPGDNAMNDSGSGNVVQINSGDPAWAMGDIRAGSVAGTSGAYYQNGSSVTVNWWMRLGVGAGATGAYTLNSGTLYVNGVDMKLRIGELGAGTLTLNGGTLDRSVASAANYTVLGSRDGADFGAAGSSGTVNHNGGTFASSGEIWVGNGALGAGVTAGTYNLHAPGVLTVNNWFVVGRNGATGVLNMDGGSLTKGTATGNISVGTYGGTATLNVSGGALTNTASQTWAGEGGGTVVWNMTGGKAVLGATVLGYNSNAKATLNVSGAATTFNTGVLHLGYGNNVAGNTAQGYVVQTSGAVTAGAADTRFGGGVGVNDVNAVGIYTISGGTLTLPQTQVGSYGQGGLYVSGSGAVTHTAGYPCMGRFTGSFGVLDLNGGSFTHNTAGTLLIVGELGTGVVNVRGGTLTSVSTDAVRAISVAHGVGGVGVVNLLGGTLNTLAVGMGTGTSSTLNFHGGTLQARGANATFVSGLTKAYVRSGGAVIDSQGFAVTIPQALVPPTGAGVATIPVATGGAGYSAAPLVKITGGGGSGATAVAVLSGGSVASILVTCPGVNYTSAPTVALVGGGSTTAATPGAATLADNVSGGLTKAGTGMLTLAGVNTYTGDTTINAGTLSVNAATGVPSNTVVRIASGAVLNLNFAAKRVRFSRLFLNGVEQRAGIYAASQLAPYVTGSGTLQVGSAAPFHRWSFNGTLADATGNSDATIVEVGANNATLGAADVTLAGGAKGAADYVRLGVNLLPDTDDALTLELWTTPLTIQNWSRLFDFGASTTEYLMMSWTQGADQNLDRVSWKDGATESALDNTCRPYTLGTKYHVVMTIEPGAGAGGTTRVTWYRAPATDADLGAARGTFDTAYTLATLNDIEDNLGRSFFGDNTANASYDEVRIWLGAKSAYDREVLHDVGPNALKPTQGSVIMMH